MQAGEPGTPLGWGWKGASGGPSGQAGPQSRALFKFRIQCHTLKASGISSWVGMGFTTGHIAPGEKKES